MAYSKEQIALIKKEIEKRNDHQLQLFIEFITALQDLAMKQDLLKLSIWNMTDYLFLHTIVKIKKAIG